MAVFQQTIPLFFARLLCIRISLKSDIINLLSDVINITKDVNMITGSQIRAARFALRMSALDLAVAAKVSLPTVQRFEQVDDIPPSRSSTLMDVKRALEAAGIEFIGSPDDAPGIRIHRRVID